MSEETTFYLYAQVPASTHHEMYEEAARTGKTIGQLIASMWLYYREGGGMQA